MMQLDVSNVSSRRLRGLVLLFIVLVIGSYSFLSYWEYSKEFYQQPAGWSDFLQGHAAAPAQYRIGVLFPANYISKLTHGHLAIRHALALLDLICLTVGVSIVFSLLSSVRFYREASHSSRCIMQLAGLLLLLFYLSWTFWYHKPETIANFASLAIAAALAAGLWRIPTLLGASGLVLISAYLGTIRADSGLALNLGLLFIAFLPKGRSFPLGRVTQILASGIGLGAVFGVESYIRYVMYPRNALSDSLFQLVTNLTSPINLFCVIFAITPYFLIVWLSLRYWRELEAWECALIVASIIEFVIFFVVARADEVRLFVPYAMVLLPTSAMLLCYELLGKQQRYDIAREPQR